MIISAVFICNSVQIVYKLKILYKTKSLKSSCKASFKDFLMVRVTGLEPVRRLTHAPQTCLSACSSTLANNRDIISLCIYLVKTFL